VTREYSAKDIDVFQNVEHVRERPHMYINGTGEEGAFQIVKELIDNSVDEWLAKSVKKIHVWVSEDGREFYVQDDGRGIPVEKHSKTGESTLTSLFTLLGAGGKFRKEAYNVSAGLHGVGLTVVNALTETLEVWTVRTKKVFYQRFGKGKKQSPVKKLASDNLLKRGTRVRGTLDPSIFGSARIPLGSVERALLTSAVLCPGLEATLEVQGEKVQSYFQKGGLKSFLADAFGNIDVGPIYLKTPKVEVAIGWVFTDAESEPKWTSFCNVTHTPQGGTHVMGAQKGVSKAMMSFARGKGVSSRDLLDGLVGSIHVLCPDPKFLSQSKLMLTNAEIYSEVWDEVRVAVSTWIRKNKKQAKYIVDRAVELKSQRNEYQKARATLRKVEKSKRGTLPPKLASSPRCVPEKRELFIVEGDSAGGSAISARNPKFQEVLPLRGKMPNASRTKLAKLLENTEMQAILQSIGGGFGADFKLDQMRVGRVFLLMDADPDGSHLVCLLLTFFLRYMLPLVEAGKLLVVDSPLFVGESGVQRWFGQTKEEIKSQSNGKPVIVTRLKGHGSSTVEDLRFYALGENRKLVKVTPEGVERVMTLMGDETEVRKQLLGL
jgi:DNA gyrase subunit B